MNGSDKDSKIFLLDGSTYTTSAEIGAEVVEQMRNDDVNVIEFPTRSDVSGSYVMTVLKSSTVGVMNYVYDEIE